jgi:hypothetical protein
MGHNREMRCDEGWCCEYIRDGGGGFCAGRYRAGGWMSGGTDDVAMDEAAPEGVP